MRRSFDLTEMASKLDVWSLKEDSTALIQFAALEKLHPDYVYRWSDSSDEFKEALEIAKSRIAVRLRKLLNDKDRLIMMELGFHDKFFHDYQESLKDRAAERQAKIENNKQPIHVTMTDYSKADP